MLYSKWAEPHARDSMCDTLREAVEQSNCLLESAQEEVKLIKNAHEARNSVLGEKLLK